MEGGEATVFEAAWVDGTAVATGTVAVAIKGNWVRPGMTANANDAISRT